MGRGGIDTEGLEIERVGLDSSLESEATLASSLIPPTAEQLEKDRQEIKRATGEEYYPDEHIVKEYLFKNGSSFMRLAQEAERMARAGKADGGLLSALNELRLSLHENPIRPHGCTCTPGIVDADNCPHHW
jgi:hypothetical protein